MILTEYDEKKVMENLKKESYEDGWEEGKEKGREEGILLMNELSLKLISLNRIDDLKQAVSNKELRDKLLNEFFPEKR